MSCQNPQLYSFILLFIARTEIKTVLPKPTFRLPRPANLGSVSQRTVAGSPPECGLWIVPCLPEIPHDIREEIPKGNGQQPQSSVKIVLFRKRRPCPTSGHRYKLRGLTRSQSMINLVSLLRRFVGHALILPVPHQLTGRI